MSITFTKRKKKDGAFLFAWKHKEEKAEILISFVCPIGLTQSNTNAWFLINSKTLRNPKGI